MTQKQLADRMNISDKTISKWERGLGCPDVSLHNELSALEELEKGETQTDKEFRMISEFNMICGLKN